MLIIIQKLRDGGLPDASTYEGDMVTIGDVVFTKMRSGSIVVWAFKEEDLQAVAVSFGLELRDQDLDGEIEILSLEGNSHARA